MLLARLSHEQLYCIYSLLALSCGGLLSLIYSSRIPLFFVSRCPCLSVHTYPSAYNCTLLDWHNGALF
jgi:hypothetical protein